MPVIGWQLGLMRPLVYQRRPVAPCWFDRLFYALRRQLGKIFSAAAA
jgi:hypothetical protein